MERATGTKKSRESKKLSKEVSQRTASASALPLAALYADTEAKDQIGTAIQTTNAYLTLAWSKDLPKKVYVKEANQAKAISLALANIPEGVGSPVVYLKSSNDKLQISELPEFGKYELQIVMPSTDANRAAVEIFLGEYTDGHMEIPAEKISSLQRELKIEEAAVKPANNDSIALLKTAEGYLPVGIYIATKKKLEPI